MPVPVPGMAAAALTAMMGGTIENCMDAASVGLQNITGLACDPVGNRVECRASAKISWAEATRSPAPI